MDTCLIAEEQYVLRVPAHLADSLRTMIETNNFSQLDFVMENHNGSDSSGGGNGVAPNPNYHNYRDNNNDDDRDSRMRGSIGQKGRMRIGESMYGFDVVGLPCYAETHKVSLRPHSHTHTHTYIHTLRCRHWTTSICSKSQISRR